MVNIQEEFVINALKRILDYYVTDELLRDHAESDFWALIQVQYKNKENFKKIGN